MAREMRDGGAGMSLSPVPRMRDDINMGDGSSPDFVAGQGGEIVADKNAIGRPLLEVAAAMLPLQFQAGRLQGPGGNLIIESEQPRRQESPPERALVRIADESGTDHRRTAETNSRSKAGGEMPVGRGKPRQKFTHGGRTGFWK